MNRKGVVDDDAVLSSKKNISEVVLNENEEDYKKDVQQGERGAHFLFFGDLMLDRYVRTILDDKGVDYLLENLSKDGEKFFSGFDLVGANLEGAVTENGEHYSPVKTHDFAFNPDYVLDLKKYGFNFFNLANNHFYDQGQDGLLETRKILNDQGYLYSGNHLREINEDVYRIIEVGDKQVAMIGLNITAGMFDLEDFENLTKELKQKSDILVVNIHWGVEYSIEQNSKQIDLAHNLVDIGVDLIIGHHPHVVQGVEVYKGKFIFYSLGNFIFDQYFSEDTQTGLAVGIDFSENTRVDLFPIQSKMSHVEFMEGQQKIDFLEKLAKVSNLEEIKTDTLENGYIIIEN